MPADSRLSAAADRLETALRQFEVAVSGAQAERRRTMGFEAEATALRSDRMRIAEELELVRRKAHELAGTGTKAAGKIDAAMARIRAVIHSNSGE